MTSLKYKLDTLVLEQYKWPVLEIKGFFSAFVLRWRLYGATQRGLHLTTHAEIETGYIQYGQLLFVSIDLFILKNMGAAIIDFRVCPPLVKCKNLMFSGFIDTLMYSFSSTGVTIYCYFGLKFNDNTCCEVICKRRYNDNK